MPEPSASNPDRPWIFRTYAGHSSPRVERALPPQPGRGPDRAVDRVRSADPVRLRLRPPARAARGRQGRRADRLARRHARAVRRHPARADEHVDDDQRHGDVAARAVRRAGRASAASTAAPLRGTTQNDIVKEYLARGTYIFPPEPSPRADRRDVRVLRRASCREWNPSNICSYHLQEAGATPVQELAFALADAIGVLDRVRARGRVDADAFAACVGRVSFFVNAGIRFVEEMCKMRAFAELWDEITPRALRRRPIRSCASSATACRSTRSASPSSSPRTTRGAS